MTATKTQAINRFVPLFQLIHAHEHSWRYGISAFQPLDRLAGSLNVLLAAQTDNEVAETAKDVSRWMDEHRVDAADPIVRAIRAVDAQ